MSADKNHSALANALAALFDAIRPGTRAEAEDELRTAGIDPEAVGQRIKQLADAMLDHRDQDAVAALPATRRVRSSSRLAWSLAATVIVCLIGWTLLRDAGDGGLLQQYRERLQRNERTQREQQAAGRLPRVESSSRVQRAEEEEAPPPTAISAPPTMIESGAAPDRPSSEFVTTLPLPSSELVAGGVIPGGAIAAGEVVTARNLVGLGTSAPPGVGWAVNNGLQIRTIEPRAVVLPQAYREATDQYSGGVKLGPDGASLKGYVAGLPFPAIDPNDRQAAIKIMWNHEYRPLATDDLEAIDFQLESGTLGENGRGITIDRRVVFEAVRRLYYNGRLAVGPRFELPNPDGIRFRESLHPLVDPVDLRGSGQSSVRYLDVQKPDDTWVFFADTRRIRRLGVAARSDPLWGQDNDPDSFFGYSGPVGGTTWRLIGEGEMVGCVHAANRPVQWGSGSADFMFDDVWETRPVFVVEGVSKLPYYGYSKRVLYIDREAWVILFSDIYDRAGELSKVWINMFSIAGEIIDNPAAVMIDVQRRHATRIAVPNRDQPATSGWTFNQGEEGGITEDWFKLEDLTKIGR